MVVWRTVTDVLKRRPEALRLADWLGRGRGRCRWLDALSRPVHAPHTPDVRDWERQELAAAWIGHATVLLRMGGGCQGCGAAFILPPQSHNNRVIAPGSEDLLGSNGQLARFFLVGTRPGMMYETGSAFTPAVQIDPILPANLKFTLRYPDGKEVTAAARGDTFGSAVGTRWVLDQPGVGPHAAAARRPGRTP